MSQVIEQLAELFNQRREIDVKILELLGEQPDEAPTPKAPRTTKKRGGRRKAVSALGRPRKVRDYACEMCKQPFKSNLKLREVKCPNCFSTKVLEVK